jgi:hypothetical protein
VGCTGARTRKEWAGARPCLHLSSRHWKIKPGMHMRFLEISCSLEPDAEAVALVLPIQQYSDRRISRARVLAL